MIITIIIIIIIIIIIKIGCLVHEMLHIKQLRPRLNVQTNSISAKVFV